MIKGGRERKGGKGEAERERGGKGGRERKECVPTS